MIDDGFIRTLSDVRSAYWRALEQTLPVGSQCFVDMFDAKHIATIQAYCPEKGRIVVVLSTGTTHEIRPKRLGFSPK